MNQNLIFWDIESAQIWKIENSGSLIWIFQFRFVCFTLVVANYLYFKVGLWQHNLIWSFDSNFLFLFFIRMQVLGLTFQAVHSIISQPLIFKDWLSWTLIRNGLKAYSGSAPGCSTLSYLTISWLILEW
jgi:hypothetical protein